MTEPGETNALVAYGFPTGTLSVRYLGLPLISRKLRLRVRATYDQTACSIQILGGESIVVCRQIAVVASVIYGSANFWMSTFILPKEYIKRIDCVPGSCGLETRMLLAKLRAHGIMFACQKWREDSGWEILLSGTEYSTWVFFCYCFLIMLRCGLNGVDNITFTTKASGLFKNRLLTHGSGNSFWTSKPKLSNS